MYAPEQVSAWLHRGRRTRDEFIEEQVVAHPRWRLARIDPKKLETRRGRKWGYVMRGREASNYDGVVAEYASLDPWAAPPGIASRDGSWPLPAFGSPRPTLPRGHFRMIDGNHRADAGKVTGVPVLVFVPAEEIDSGNVRHAARRRSAAANGSRRTGWRGHTPDLAYYGLDGIVRGEPTILYHGTTASFRTFDASKSRKELVDNFYGDGIFLTPSEAVARKYANANRNAGLPESIIADYARVNPSAAAFMRALYMHGMDGWELFARERGFMNDRPMRGEGQFDTAGFEKYIGVDGNDIADVAKYIVGSASVEAPSEQTLFDVFHQSTGAPSWLYDSIDRIGMDSSAYRPKVYTAIVRVKHTLVTASKAAAKRARRNGYDSVIFYGDDIVDGVPEIAVYDNGNVEIIGVELADYS